MAKDERSFASATTFVLAFTTRTSISIQDILIFNNTRKMADSKPDFGVICRHKDSNSSNLTEVFDSYGCNTLEAKVFVVDEPVVEELANISRDQQIYGTLALKTASVNRAMMGRGSRTSSRDLKIVQIAGETILAAGPVRERSPVDGDELDDELDQYMKEAARLRELKKSGSALKENTSLSSNLPQVTKKSTLPRERKTYAQIAEEADEKMEEDQDLDQELQEYMAEAARKREQKRKLEEQTDRALAMKAMEEDFDNFDDDDL